MVWQELSPSGLNSGNRNVAGMIVIAPTLLLSIEGKV
jgi:hypothetical protein